jgi:hypothetical protein
VENTGKHIYLPWNLAEYRSFHEFTGQPGTPFKQEAGQSVSSVLTFCMAVATQVQKNLQAAMREALRIQDRFVAEPLFAKTGRGYLKIEGVDTLQKIKSNLRHRPAKSK